MFESSPAEGWAGGGAEGAKWNVAQGTEMVSGDSEGQRAFGVWQAAQTFEPSCWCGILQEWGITWMQVSINHVGKDNV